MRTTRTFNSTIDAIWILTRSVAVGAILCGACAVFPHDAAAQAPAGPIRPAADAGDSRAGSSGPAVQPEMVIPDKKQLFASWKFNVDESDDAQDKMREARGTNADNPANPRGGGGNGTGIHMGGIGSPYPGGGGNGGGSGGNPRNGGSKNADSDYDRQQLQELLNPAGSITLAMKDTSDAKNGEVLLTDDAGRQRAFYTDGHKLQKSKDDKYQEFDAHWEDYRLVADQGGSHGPQITRSFEPAPGGKQLYEIVRLERTRSNGPVEIRFVYDLVGDSNPPVKKP
ncbi:MAG: hypothetical protein ABSC10_11285 [Candidatus Acidiferrales bacterium]|jgi:hypothetical protein